MTFLYTVSFSIALHRNIPQTCQILLYIIDMSRFYSHFYICMLVVILIYRINLEIQIRIKLEQTLNIESLLYRNI